MIIGINSPSAFVTRDVGFFTDVQQDFMVLTGQCPFFAVDSTDRDEDERGAAVVVAAKKATKRYEREHEGLSSMFGDV